MLSPPIPLLLGAPPPEHEINVTTSSSPPNFSRPTQWHDLPARSYTSHYASSKLQQPLHLTSYPDTNYKRIRRKPSSINLYDTLVSSPTSLPVISCAPSLQNLQNFPHEAHLRSTSPTPPSPSHHDFDAQSPSLSSTVDTLDSTPTHSPSDDRQFAANNDLPTGPRRIADGALVSTKRKFPAFKAAKRLPKRDRDCDGNGGGGWFVYAAIVDGGALAHVPRAEESESASVDEEVQVKAAPKRCRSVKFAGVESERSSGRGTDLASASLSGGKDPATDSSFTLSKFKFPAPPGNTWAGTFGHLEEHTPPTSPTTLHYRGASFDVVNPHASLLLGAKDFETPGEIDGLLDDYFSRPSPRTPIRTTMENMMPQPDGSSTKSSVRRHRPLYDDADSARRNIMRLPNTPSHEPGTISPLATATSDHEHGLDGSRDATHAGDTAGVERESSSVYPHSTISNPFDLSVSDDGEEGRVGNIDAVIATAGPKMAPSGEDGANAHATSTTHNDSTLGHVYDHYAGYTDVPLSPHLAASSQETIVPAARQVGENGVPPLPMFGRQDEVLANEEGSPMIDSGLFHRLLLSRINNAFSHRNHVRNPFSQDHLTDSPGEMHPPPPSPISGAPVHGIAPGPTTWAPFNMAESSDPTSERTYGQTSDLLQITPRTGPASLPPNSEDHSEYARDSYPPGDQNDLVGGRQENVSPVVRQAEIPAAWSDVDLPVERRSGEQLYGRPASSQARVASSIYPDDDTEWEDTQASQSQPVLREGQSPVILREGPERISTVSYADTSDHGSVRTWAPHGQANTHDDPMPERLSNLRHFQIEASRGTTTGPPDAHASPGLHNPADRARELLLIKLQRDYALTVPNVNRVFTEEERAQHRAEAAELEEYRRHMPHMVRAASQQAMREFEALQSRQNQESLTNYAADDTLHRPERTLQRQNSWDAVASQSLYSDTRPFLRGDESPHGTLTYSDTHQTFITIRSAASQVYPEMTVHDRQPRSPRLPIMSGALPNAIPDGIPVHSPATTRAFDANDIELMPITRTRRGQASIRGQTSLRPITLGDSATDTYRPWTDEQLAAAEPHWCMGRSRFSRTAQQLRRFSVPRLERTPRPRLMSVGEGAHTSTHDAQQVLSEMYLWRFFIWFPPLALAFGLGGLDWVIRRKTKGRITEMREREKLVALYLGLPLGIIGYAFVGTIITIIVLSQSGNLVGTSD